MEVKAPGWSTSDDMHDGVKGKKRWKKCGKVREKVSREKLKVGWDIEVGAVVSRARQIDVRWPPRTNRFIGDISTARAVAGSSVRN